MDLSTTKEFKRSRIYTLAKNGLDLSEAALALRALLAVKPAEYPEKNARAELEMWVYAELGQVLGLAKSELKKILRPPRKRRSAAWAPDELVEGVTQPALENYESIGVFAVQNALLLGEFGHGVRQQAKPGIWFGYTPMADTEPVLIAVHSESVHRLADLVAGLRAVGEYRINAASMTVADAGARDSDAFVAAVERGTFGPLDARGVQINVQDECTALAAAAPQGQHALCVSLALG